MCMCSCYIYTKWHFSYRIRDKHHEINTNRLSAIEWEEKFTSWVWHVNTPNFTFFGRGGWKIIRRRMRSTNEIQFFICNSVLAGERREQKKMVKTYEIDWFLTCSTQMHTQCKQQYKLRAPKKMEPHTDERKGERERRGMASKSLARFIWKPIFFLLSHSSCKCMANIFRSFVVGECRTIYL